MARRAKFSSRRTWFVNHDFRGFSGSKILIFDLGRLSILTEEIVSAAAASEIKTGRRVGLGWDLTKQVNEREIRCSQAPST